MFSAMEESVLESETLLIFVRGEVNSLFSAEPNESHHIAVQANANTILSLLM